MGQGRGWGRWAVGLGLGLAVSTAGWAQSPLGGPDPWEELERESQRYREAELPPPLSPPEAAAAEPAEAGQPAEPAQPAKPAKAAQPTKPAKAAQPTKPARAAQPTKPAEAAKAARPSKPAQPARPIEVAKPAQPARPASGDLDAPLDLRQLDRARLATAIVEATHAARRRHGLPALPAEPRLTAAAQGHAERMAQLRFFDHTDPHSAAHRTPKDRAALAGVANPHIAENIATQFALQHDGGQLWVIDRQRGAFARTPRGAAIPMHTYRSFAARVVQRWLDSPGHRRNLLSPKGLQMGAGAAVMPDDGDGFPKLTAVQVFQWFAPVR